MQLNDHEQMQIILMLRSTAMVHKILLLNSTVGN